MAVPFVLVFYRYCQNWIFLPDFMTCLKGKRYEATMNLINCHEMGGAVFVNFCLQSYIEKDSEI